MMTSASLQNARKKPQSGPEHNLHLKVLHSPHQPCYQAIIHCPHLLVYCCLHQVLGRRSNKADHTYHHGTPHNCTPHDCTSHNCTADDSSAHHNPEHLSYWSHTDSHTITRGREPYSNCHLSRACHPRNPRWSCCSRLCRLQEETPNTWHGSHSGLHQPQLPENG